MICSINSYQCEEAIDGMLKQSVRKIEQNTCNRVACLLVKDGTICPPVPGITSFPAELSDDLRKKDEAYKAQYKLF